MSDLVAAHDPAAEAAAAVGDRYDVRVLEPSPPAAAEGPFWADDPADPGPSGDNPVVAPHCGGDVDRSDPFWNEEDFNGASLTFRDLVSADDHHGAAVAFLRAGYACLNR